MTRLQPWVICFTYRGSAQCVMFLLYCITLQDTSGIFKHEEQCFEHEALSGIPFSSSMSYCWRCHSTNKKLLITSKRHLDLARILRHFKMLVVQKAIHRLALKRLKVWNKMIQNQAQEEVTLSVNISKCYGSNIYPSKCEVCCVKVSSTDPQC